MKNFINYYYGLIVERYIKNDESYNLVIDGEKYVFKPLLYDESYIYNIYLTTIKHNKLCYKIVYNIYGSISSIYERINYILIKINEIFIIEFNLNNIIKYNYIPNFISKIDWKKLWQNKIDYYEYQINQLSYKYEIIKNSINYYIGLSECAISILNYVNLDSIFVGICHRRLSNKDINLEFFDPTNLVFDNFTRDISEYLKNIYFFKNIPSNEIILCIDNLKLSNEEAILLLARMIYPSYYFDMYDKVLKGSLNEKKINYIIKNNASYETLLKKLYYLLKTKYDIPNIEWLN